MMPIKISAKDLGIIAERIGGIKEYYIQSYLDFLKENNDDCYFYGRKPQDSKYLKITIQQLEQILWILSRVNRRYPLLFSLINRVYKDSITSGLDSVFLCRRNKS